MKKSARKQTVLAKTKRVRDAEIIPFDVMRYLTNEKRVAQYLDALVEARVPVLLTTFDSAKHLKSNKAIAAYLNDALLTAPPMKFYWRSFRLPARAECHAWPKRLG